MYFFDKTTERLVSYVLQNNAEGAIAILKEGNFHKNILTDLRVCRKTLPLYKLSVCNRILLFEDSDWSDSVMPLIEYNRKSCQQMLDFWKYEYGYPVDEDFDFSAYADGCGHFRFRDYEELFDASLDELVAMGYDRDEVEFCYAVLVYDADLIKKHIALKTNPNVFISGEKAPGTGNRYDGSSYGALSSCDDFYYDAVIHYGVIDCWTANQNKNDISVGSYHVLNLLQSAAYFRLGKQLKMLENK